MSSRFTRREVLGLALASPPVAAVSGVTRAQGKSKQVEESAVANAPGRVVAVNDTPALRQVELRRRWRGSICISQLINHGREPVAIKEVVLFDLPLKLPPATGLYGEDFQMLSQTGGTLSLPVNYSQYTDAQHYKLPAPADARVFYGMMTLSPPQAGHQLFGFTSCRRVASHRKEARLNTSLG